MADEDEGPVWQGGEGEEDQQDPQGRTALMRAAAGGDEAEVERLLALGADPALRDAGGLSAGDHARAGGHAALAERFGPAEDAERTLR